MLKNIRAIRSSCERTAANKDPRDPRDLCAKKYSFYSCDSCSKNILWFKKIRVRFVFKTSHVSIEIQNSTLRFGAV